MDNKVKMLNADGCPVYVAPECVKIFERSGYKFASEPDKEKPARENRTEKKPTRKPAKEKKQV